MASDYDRSEISKLSLTRQPLEDEINTNMWESESTRSKTKRKESPKQTWGGMNSRPNGLIKTSSEQPNSQYSK